MRCAHYIHISDITLQKCCDNHCPQIIICILISYMQSLVTHPSHGCDTSQLLSGFATDPWMNQARSRCNAAADLPNTTTGKESASLAFVYLRYIFFTTVTYWYLAYFLGCLEDADDDSRMPHRICPTNARIRDMRPLHGTEVG